MRQHLQNHEETFTGQVISCPLTPSEVLVDVDVHPEERNGHKHLHVSIRNCVRELVGHLYSSKHQNLNNGHVKDEMSRKINRLCFFWF